MIKKGGLQKPVPLFRWIWHSYLKTALIPLVVVELVFIMIYFATNHWSRQETFGFLRSEVQTEIEQLARREATVIQEEISSVAHAVELYSRQVQRALGRQVEFAKIDKERLAYSPEGVYYTTRDKSSGGVAVFYSGYVPIGQAEQAKVAKMLTLESLMVDIQQSEPLAASIYINTHDSLNVIYPYFDVISQYATKMDIPSYNFYYEADADHNPERKVVWTDAYLDPAGHGWMASALAPVYQKDKLEGVAGIDVTVGTIAEKVLQLELPWDGYGVLVGEDGTILALPPQGEKDFVLTELKEHDYKESILQDTFKPEEFNLYKRSDLKEISEAISTKLQGFGTANLGQEKKVFSWATVPDTGWKLLVIVPESSVYAGVNQMQRKLFLIGSLMIIGLFCFYFLFFGVLFKRARLMSTAISEPLMEIDAMVDKIGEGDYYQEAKSFNVIELNETASGLVGMGHNLGDANANLLQVQKSLEESKNIAEEASQAKSQFLSQMSHELRTPLNAILGFAQVLQMDKQSPLAPIQKESVDEIYNAGLHLLELINEVLDLARIEAGKMPVVADDVWVPEVIDEVAALVRPLAEHNHITLTLDIFPGEEYHALADRLRLKQVLVNLATNAIKYNQPDGQVIMRASRDQGEIVIDVQDTGIGMSQEELDQIFHPFYRTALSGDTVEGTGIGLTVSKQLVELMGGNIGATSVSGEGSHFWVRLPEVEPALG